MTAPKKPPTPRARKLPLGSVSRATQSGNGFEAIRGELARRMDDPNLEARDLPALAREYRQLTTAIDALGVGVKGDGVDEVAAARRRRRGRSA